MQSLAGPDLPHTGTTPMQWLATATAVAGVVALASFVQPAGVRGRGRGGGAAGGRGRGGGGGDRGAAPRVVATLVDPADKLSVRDLTLTGRALSATLSGYSSTDVPRCCPDVHKAAKWQWQNGKFVESELSAEKDAEGGLPAARGV
ncbi:hypothetical protein [Streptomyces purpurogeneiscleroticus]|uniref:hypothetical protein n=1 Tax=Streptomyces purpurogeneiscleroticus TaxID=68259 RepID=UPI001CBCAE9A|nr:hypothetical protein [Streptomyces purpurogeneiscleroticus]MBZ4017425.1 hypothetical protein [Streptomyces purpurogeneiscleroticus]